MENVNNDEALCIDALADIISVRPLKPDRIKHLVKKHNELYENTKSISPAQNDFFFLYMKLCELDGLIKKTESAKIALNEFSQIYHLSTGNIIKWLVKHEEDGLYIRENVKNTKIEISDIDNEGILWLNWFCIKVEIVSFIPVLDFMLTFNDHYDKTMDKYRTDNDEETYLECGVEYYKSNNEQRRLMDFVRHLINPPIEDIFSQATTSLDYSKLKNYVPLKVEHHSHTPSTELQAAHDLFHQDKYEDAKFKYTELLQSRNDFQEAWLGLTISNFILGDFDAAYIASSKLLAYQYRDLIRYIEKYKQNDSKSENEFYIADKTCEESVNDYKTSTDKLAWLAENRALYNSISIRPEGLPSIASCCLNGKHYENISVFHSTYCDAQIDENILDTKTHLEAVIHFIEKMDIKKLDELLLKQSYSSISKAKFMVELKGVFDRFNDSKDTVLYAEPGICQGCNNGCGGFTFLSNKSRNYIDLVIKSEDNIVTDIFECSQFKNDNLVKSMLGKRITFYKNDMPF
jgi:tetratricopeptide (TPR) repeat protein